MTQAWLINYTKVCGWFHSGMCEFMILAQTWISEVPSLGQCQQEAIMTMACTTIRALQIKGTEHSLLKVASGTGNASSRIWRASQLIFGEVPKSIGTNKEAIQQ